MSLPEMMRSWGLWPDEWINLLLDSLYYKIGKWWRMAYLRKNVTRGMSLGVLLYPGLFIVPFLCFLSPHPSWHDVQTYLKPCARTNPSSLIRPSFCHRNLVTTNTLPHWRAGNDWKWPNLAEVTPEFVPSISQLGSFQIIGCKINSVDCHQNYLENEK